MKLDIRLRFAAAAVLLAGVGGAAFAHPHPEGDSDGKTVKRFILVEDAAEAGHDGNGERIRRFEIVREGGDHAAADGPQLRRFEIRDGATVDCSGADKIVDESEVEDGKKTKIVICTKGTPTMTAEHLEQALARIANNDELSDAQKARIESALRLAMDRARSVR